MDETPIFFTPALNGAISYKGAKQVVVSTQDQEKQRLTIVLSIAGNNSDSHILYNRIYKIPFFKKKKIF